MLHGFGERAADAQNIAIAFGVAKPIIAMFEMVDVNIGAGKGVAFAPELLDVTVESVAVAQVGERVDMGVALKQPALLLQDGMRLLQLELADLDVNMFSAVDNSLINDGCGLFRGRLILPYEHLSRFQNDVID